MAFHIGKVRVGDWFEGIFNLNGIERVLQHIPKPLEEALHIGASVAEAAKNFVYSPGADVITMLIPGTIDDKIKEALRAALPKIVVELKLADSCLHLTDPNEIVACAIKTLQQVAGDFKSGFLDEFATQVGVIAADGKFDWNDIKYIIKWYYDHKFKPSLPAAA